MSHLSQSFNTISTIYRFIRFFIDLSKSFARQSDETVKDAADEQPRIVATSQQPTASL